MLLGSRTILLSKYQGMFIWLIVIQLGIIFPAKKICYAEDWRDKKYIQSLPDPSFTVVEKKPNGAVIRSLPHHDKQGNLVLPKVEESLDRVFELDPNHQEKARDHLLGHYYEYMSNPNH